MKFGIYLIIILKWYHIFCGIMLCTFVIPIIR